MAKSPAKSKAEPLVRPENGALVVTALQPGGRRRAGYSFSSEPTTIPLDDLSDDEIKAIDADPLLSVKGATVKPEPEPEAPAA